VQIRDQEVLAKFPRAVKQRVLSTLYAAPISACYLLRAPVVRDHPAFLLALLDLGDMEVYMPGVDVVERGSKVSDFQILLRGSMRVRPARLPPQRAAAFGPARVCHHAPCPSVPGRARGQCR
jgi:hypothetical protein